MREQDATYVGILKKIDTLEDQIVNIVSAIDDAQMNANMAESTLAELKKSMELRGSFIKENKSQSLALESVKHLRREAQRIEENLLKDS